MPKDRIRKAAPKVTDAQIKRLDRKNSIVLFEAIFDGAYPANVIPDVELCVHPVDDVEAS